MLRDYFLLVRKDNTEVTVIKMKKKSVLGALVGGIAVVSVTTAVLMRYKSVCQLKEDVTSIPYDLERPFNWKHYFRNY